jgi:hypothetical protein
MLACRTVYGIYYPETRRIVDDLWAQRPHHWYERNYEKRQDAMHGPLLTRWRSWSRDAGVHLGDGFAHQYPTAGANEGIHAVLAHLASRPGEPRPRVHVFEGEYEGYPHIAAALGLEVRTHARDPELYATTLAASARPGDWFFLSQPSAIDGDVWPGLAGFLAWLHRESPAVSVAVDLTYVGAVARDFTIDLDSANVAVALFSLSKPFGVYYHRVGGLLARQPLALLHGNLWFKNLFSLHLGERLMAEHAAHDLPRRYLPVQQRALSAAIAEGVVDPSARASDAVMLATATVGSGDGGEFFRCATREGISLRWCLAPGIDALVSREGGR